MVHIVTPANRHIYREEIEDMYRLRYHVAVRELGWTIPEILNARDVDAFDTGSTVYFLDYDPDGQLIATARLNPTLEPHLMTEIFPHLCELNGVPRAGDIYEYSRFLVKKTGVPRRINIKAQARISLAIVEYCLAAGINHVSWVSYKRSYPLALRMWKTRPLGLPRYFDADDAYYIAAISDMTEESLQRTRDLARVKGPVSRITMPLEIAPELAHISNSHSVERLG